MYKIILVGLAAFAYTVYDPTALSAPIIAGLCVVALIILVIGRLFGIVERDIANRRPEDRRQSGGTAGENWGPNQQD